MTSPAAYHHNGAPCTAGQFYAIACDPARSVVVEACAGAGKTWMLVSRILRALLAGSAPHEILAITFTRKAAGEMRERLLEWLGEFARPKPADPEEGRQAETPDAWSARLQKELMDRGISLQAASGMPDLLRNLYQSMLAHGRPVQIRTFHGWFATLLQSAPLRVLQDLGLPSSYELLEDDKDAVAEVWRPFLRRVAADPGLVVDYAGLVGALGRTRAHQALEGALARRTEFLLADASGHVEDAVERFDRLYPHMAGIDQPAGWLLERKTGQGLLRDAADALGRLSRTHAEKGAELAKALQAHEWDAVVAALFTQKREPRAFAKDKTPSIVRSAQDEVKTLLTICAQHEAWQHQQRMTRLVRVLIECFAELKRERGWVDMNDIERAALTLLAEHDLSAWVQERLDLRIRHLLIDEFQDTNPLQWQALHAWLAGYAGAGGGQGAPSVFIVGDPKQSIYRFRRADPKVFAAAQTFVVQALGGERLATDHTRRNAAGVLAVVNTVMESAHEAGEFPGFRAHTTGSDQAGAVQVLPLIPRPPRKSKNGDEEPMDWRDTLAEPRVIEKESLRQAECRQAARWIAGRVAAGVQPEGIMVLARKREPLGVLQEELRKLGIACEQPERQDLGAQPAVLDVLALVDALVSPGNDLMLARALKSPLFGLVDEDLARLALAVRATATDDKPGWLQALAVTELVTQDGPALHADLLRYRGWLLGLPPHDALQAIYDDRSVLERFVAAAPVAERAHVAGQLRALPGAALMAQGGRFLTAYQWLRIMRRKQTPAPNHAMSKAVRLLTVHGAKGLEAEEILLLDSASGISSRGAPGVLMDWPGDQTAPRSLIFLARDNDPPPGVMILAEQEDAADTREELNALYVAMTRARQRLVLSATEPYAKPASSWWQRIQPLAESLPEPEPAQPLAAAKGEPFEIPELPPAPNLLVSADEPMQEVVETGGQATEASLVGEAMHWLLEHAGDSPEGWQPVRLAQARRRLGLAPEQVARADSLARRIFTGAAAWAWAESEVLEAFDEVEIVYQGQRLRIDRLVRRSAGSHGPEAWWVLDYKSAAAPERDSALHEQLARYRAAIALLHPDAAVRAAFLGGDGRLTELP